MNSGKLWCEEDGWMREVVWLAEPNIRQCNFLSMQGETIILNAIKKIMMFKSGDYTISLKDGRTFELTI